MKKIWWERHIQGTQDGKRVDEQTWVTNKEYTFYTSKKRIKLKQEINLIIYHSYRRRKEKSIVIVPNKARRVQYFDLATQ